MPNAIENVDSAVSGLLQSNRTCWREIDRAVLTADYVRVRATTEQLASNLSGEDQQIQSMAEASPVKWHRAHTTWFFETFVLKPLNLGYQEIDPTYAYLFNSYYNAIGEQYPREQRGKISRPDIGQIAEYRRHVDEAVVHLLETCPDEQLEALMRLLVLGFNHEQQHQELIVTDLKHAFAQNPRHPAWTELPAPNGLTSRFGWQKVGGGIVEIGADGEQFCFDNETPRHRVLVSDFEIADRPVTCGEFLAFMADGGYETPALWLADGWEWVQSNNISAPAYWRTIDGQWHLYTLGGLREIDPDETLCHVSYYEADAFAKWAGARLPTEIEWETAAGNASTDGDWADNCRFHPGRAGQGNGLRQLFGSVWEWTASSYAAYLGFKPPADPTGEYNGKFMANQMVLRGGSCATPPGHIRKTYRNFFYPGDRWQYSGIRLAKSP